MSTSRAKRRTGGLLRPGMYVSSRVLAAARASASVEVPDPAGILHLQFRRYAGCPICNLHLRTFARRYDELREAGIGEVAVFHSAAELLAPLSEDFPFPLVPDPDRELYREFGVERSWAAITHPSAVLAAVRGWLRRSPHLPSDDGAGHLGLPADFLIASDGRLLAVRYGAHANDHWSVDEVLRLAAGGSGRS